MKTTLDDDTISLIKAAKQVLRDQAAWNEWEEKENITWASLDTLAIALIPFQPDPDLPLLQKMANAMSKACGIGDNQQRIENSTLLPGFKAVLEVVRQAEQP